MSSEQGHMVYKLSPTLRFVDDPTSMQELLTEVEPPVVSVTENDIQNILKLSHFNDIMNTRNLWFIEQFTMIALPVQQTPKPSAQVPS